MNQKIKERPILFNAEMVRAILAGRKTQTRRALKDQDNYVSWNCATRVFESDYLRQFLPGADESSFVLQENSGELVDSKWQPVSCPLGKVGDQLWVREAFSAMGNHEGHALPIFYRADGEDGNKWTPSIHMPRWASRVSLGVIDVRVERLQDITEDGVKAEGLTMADVAVGSINAACKLGFLRYEFANRWSEAHKHAPWSSNPWVWVVDFGWLILGYNRVGGSK